MLAVINQEAHMFFLHGRFHTDSNERESKTKKRKKERGDGVLSETQRSTVLSLFFFVEGSNPVVQLLSKNRLKSFLCWFDLVGVVNLRPYAPIWVFIILLVHATVKSFVRQVAVSVDCMMLPLKHFFSLEQNLFYLIHDQWHLKDSTGKKNQANK